MRNGRLINVSEQLNGNSGFMRISILIAAMTAFYAVCPTAQAQDDIGMFGGPMMPPPDGEPPPGMMPGGNGAPDGDAMMPPPPGIPGDTGKTAAETPFSGIESATPEQWRTLCDYLRKKYPEEFAAFEKMQSGSPRSAIAGYRKLALRDRLKLTSPRGLSAALPDDKKVIGRRDVFARLKTAEAAIAAQFPAEYEQMTELRKIDRAAARIMFAALYKKLETPARNAKNDGAQNASASAGKTSADSAATLKGKENL